MSLDADNIWEVGSTGSGCSLDDELTRELEELERKEEEQQQQTNNSHSNEGSNRTLSTSNQNGTTTGLKDDSNNTATPQSQNCEADENATDASPESSEPKEDDIVFKDTGVINVAHCNEISDAYKPRGTRRRYDHSGVPVGISRRERTRLIYQRNMANPEYVERRKEYKRQYYQKLKLMRQISRAEASNSRKAQQVSQSSSSSSSTTTSSILAKALTSTHFLAERSSLTNGKKKVRRKEPSLKDFVRNPRLQHTLNSTIKVEGQNSTEDEMESGCSSDVSGSNGSSVNRRFFSENKRSKISIKSAEAKVLNNKTSSTLEAMRLKFCPKNVIPDDGDPILPGELTTAQKNISGAELSAINEKVNKMLTHTATNEYRDPSEIYNGHPLPGNAQHLAARVFDKLEMVSLKRYKHLQLLNKRISSKCAYYQTVIRRDRAVIQKLNNELAKFNKVIDCSHMKIPQFRLKFIKNPDNDVMNQIDADEAIAYTRLQNGITVECKKLLTPLAKYDSVDDLEYNENNSFIDQDSNGPSNFVPKSSLPCPLSKKLKHEPSYHQQILNSTLERRFSKKQVAMKSSRGGLRANSIYNKRLQTNGDSLRTLDIKSKMINDLNMSYIPASESILYEKAFLEGISFSELRKRCSKSLGKNGPYLSNPPTFSSVSNVSTSSQFSNVSLPVPISNIKTEIDDDPNSLLTDVTPFIKLEPEVKLKIEPTYEPKKTTNFKKKNHSIKVPHKRIPKELEDDTYIPSGAIELKKDDSNDQMSKDTILYRDLVRLKEFYDSQELSMCDSTSVSDDLRRNITSFIEDAVTYEKCSMGNSVDVTSEDDSVQSGDVADNNSLCDGTQSESSVTSSSGPMQREQLIGLMHRRYVASHKEPCSLKVFLECLPKTIVRKPAIARGYTNCLACGHSEIKFDSLVHKGVLDFKSDFEDIWIDKEMRGVLTASLDSITDHKASMTHYHFVKSSKNNVSKSIRTTTDTVGNVIKSFRTEFNNMERHVEQVKTKYTLIRAAMDRVMRNGNEVLIHITWCDNPKVFHRSVNKQTLADQCISVLSGHVWSATEEFSFICLSDVRDHGTSSLWAHLEEPLRDLAIDGYDKMYIVSDPTVSQFRNKAHFYYMNEFAVKKNVEMRWIFSASYHTQLKADITGHKVKDMIERKTLYHVKMLGDNPYRSAHTIIEMLKSQVPNSTKLYFVRSEDVMSFVSDLPALQPIKGTQTFAEVLIGPGKFLVKLDSMEEYWTKVLIIF